MKSVFLWAGSQQPESHQSACALFPRSSGAEPGEDCTVIGTAFSIREKGPEHHRTVDYRSSFSVSVCQFELKKKKNLNKLQNNFPEQLNRNNNEILKMKNIINRFIITSL